MEILDYVPVEKYQEMERLMEEYRASWFATLSVLLLRNDLKVTVTKEEVIEARKLVITKNDLEDGSVEFTAEIVEPVKEAEPVEEMSK